MNSYLYFAILMCIFLFISAKSEIPELKSICPFNDYCSSKTKHILESNYIPCCQKCSCSSWCNTTGTCCYDLHKKYRNMQFPLPIANCLETDSILNRKRPLPADINQIKRSYRIISICPDEQSALRHPRCRDPQNLEDYIVVSDNQFEVNFLNRHCAECYGVLNVTKWHLHAVCPEIMTNEFESFEERDRYILKKCHLNIEPPNFKTEELSRCYINDDLYISSCPYFHQAQNFFYDQKKIFSACQKKSKFQNTVFKDPKSGKVYANVFCYLCNNPDQREIPLRCPGEDKSDDVAFSAVIDNLPFETGERNGPCKDNEVQDEFTGICRRLRCPLSTIPVRGRCVNTVRYAHGFTLYVLFEIVFLEGKAAYSYEIRQIIELYIEQMYQISNTTCGLCEMQFFQYKSTLLYRLPLYTTKSCPVSALIEFIRTIILRNADNLPRVCKSNTEETRFILQLYKHKMPNVDIYHSTSKLGDRCILRPIQIDSVILQDCPHLHVGVDEFYQFSGEISALETYLNPNGVISICMDTYSKMFRLSAASDVVPVIRRTAELLLLTAIFTLI